MSAFATDREIEFSEGLLQREGVRPGANGWPRLLLAEGRFIYRFEDGHFHPDKARNRATFQSESAHYATIRDCVAELLKGPLAEFDPTSCRIEPHREVIRQFI